MLTTLIPSWQLSPEQHLNFWRHTKKAMLFQAMKLQPEICHYDDIDIADLSPEYVGLYGFEWRTPPLVIGENKYLNFIVAPHDIIAFYAVAIQDKEPTVTKLTFYQGSTVLAKFELQKLYSHVKFTDALDQNTLRQETINQIIRTEGYFQSPVVFVEYQRVMVEATSCENCENGSRLILLAFVARTKKNI